MSTSEPLGDDAFALYMAALGPFETAPHLAVAVSGGADSMALCLLADRWAQAQGGCVTALTVDHGLRPESRHEAEQVGRQLTRLDIAHVILDWSGDKPQGDIQARARDARYALLQAWCAEVGVLHLLLAHNLDDQAETLLLRLGRGSGVDGLAAMSPVSARGPVQLLRPLLTVPHIRLEATLRAIGETWIEDPSNKNDRYSRARLRKMMPALQREGLTAPRLAATAAHLLRAREALEATTTDLAVNAVVLHEAGYAQLDRTRLAAAPAEITLRLLARLCRTVGGHDYPPRLERLERFYEELRRGLSHRRTLGGCLFVPLKAGTAQFIVVCRELAKVEAVRPIEFQGPVRWDRRFVLTVDGGPGVTVGALGRQGSQDLRDQGAAVLPSGVLSTLPSVRDVHGIVEVPHLGYRRPGSAAIVRRCVFSPSFALTGAGHCLVPAQGGIMS